MKTCLCCGSDALDGALSCHACGEASWSIAEPAGEPEEPKSEKRPEHAGRRKGPR